jgi:hypothetical protein
MSQYRLSVSYSGSGCSEEFYFDKIPEEIEIQGQIEEWINDVEWGDDGASIDVNWSLEKISQEIDSGMYTVDIEPDHYSLIKKACGNNGCGNSPADHDWTSEGEGGCDDNPGVWAGCGTSMTFSTHCRRCGLHRTHYWTGSQRNPGEHDTTNYEMPDNWCDKCESENCEHT